MPTGGHFAAMEQPKLLVDDIISFVSRVEHLENMGPGNLWTTLKIHKNGALYDSEMVSIVDIDSSIS